MNHIACVILNANDPKNTLELAKVLSTYEIVRDVVIVENPTTIESWNQVSQSKISKSTLLKADRNGGYGSGNNIGVNYVCNKLPEEYTLIINPDVRVSENDIMIILQEMQKDKSVACASGLQFDKDKELVGLQVWNIPSIWNCVFSNSVLFKRLVNRRYINLQHVNEKDHIEVDCVAGAMLMVQNEAFKRCEGYDERFFLYTEETELGIRLKEAGYKTILCPKSHYYHNHGSSINKSFQGNLKKKKLLVESRRKLLIYYYHPNIFQRAIFEVTSCISIMLTALKMVAVKN